MKSGLLGMSWTPKGVLACSPSRIIETQEMLILDSDHRIGSWGREGNQRLEGIQCTVVEYYWHPNNGNDMKNIFERI